MVSVIIVQYHVKDELFAAIQSIKKSKPKTAYEIIVVDNDETKTLQNDLKKKFPTVRYVPNDNKGFGQGNNTGARFAKGEYLFFLNPDTQVYSGCIDLLISYLQRHKDVGVVAPLLYDGDKKLVPLQGSKMLTPLRAIFCFSIVSKLWLNNPIARDYWYLDRWNKKLPFVVDSVPGTAFMIRRAIYKKVKGFDERFFLYFEENDFCKRVQEAGWKLVMYPAAKVSHLLGRSTKQVSNVSDIFMQSRFYYLTKHFGLLKALLAESVLRTGKYTFLLLAILLLGAFLRLDHIQQTMIFIGDQGWFYLSARDMILGQGFPLVGITSSHTWLHQGALWTYLLGSSFAILGFNPLTGAYLSIFIDLLAIYMMYAVGKVMFSRRLGVIAAALYATSPIVVLNARMPYHTSPIPFVTLLLLYAMYKWIKGRISYFPVVIFLLGILYQLEIATGLFTGIVTILLLVGGMRKEKWVEGLFRKKIVLLTLLGFVAAMLPMLLYDLQHGFPQTIGFLAWVCYKIVTIFGYPELNPSTSISPILMMQFSTEQLTRLLFPNNILIACGLFLGAVLFFLKSAFRKRTSSLLLLGFTQVILLVGFVAVATPSHAYLPMLFPGLLLLVAYLFNWLLQLRPFKASTLSFLLLIIICNSYFLITHRYSFETVRDRFSQRMDAAQRIVKESEGKPYVIVGHGEGSQFESFTMNYEYLTWYLGSPASGVGTQIVVTETPDAITITK